MREFFNSIGDRIGEYPDLVFFILLAFLLAFFATPVASRIAYMLGAVDKPRTSAGASARNLLKKINDKETPRLGGLAMVFAIAVVLALVPDFGFPSLGVWAGLALLTVVGILDDIYDLPAWSQFISHLIAAIFVVSGGATIENISIAGDLNQIFTVSTFPVGDILAVIWIVAVINFVNWVGGIDGLNGGFTAIAAFAFMLIAVQQGNNPLVYLIGVHLGAVLGVLPFNYHPSKIFYGFGDTINGFLLAVFAISGDIKFAGSIIVLGLPLIDAAWVMFNRMRTASRDNRNILKILGSTMKSDRNHLHHRLLDLGYSWKTVFFLEMAIVVALATIAFAITGQFSNSALFIMIGFTGMLGILALVSYARNRAVRLKQEQIITNPEPKKAEIQVEIVNHEQQEPDEDRYVY